MLGVLEVPIKHHTDSSNNPQITSCKQPTLSTTPTIQSSESLGTRDARKSRRGKAWRASEGGGDRGDRGWVWDGQCTVGKIAGGGAFFERWF